jgi:hypothetical protein
LIEREYLLYNAKQIHCSRREVAQFDLVRSFVPHGSAYGATPEGRRTGPIRGGQVNFNITGELGPADACHCIQCRKHSGHYFASANVPRSAITIEGEVSWYQSAADIRRGFCGVCGSSLFWDPPARDWIAIAMGALDNPTSGHLEKHIFVSEKGDYYDITDDLPQKARF